MKYKCFFVNLLLFSAIALDPSSHFSSSFILPFSNLLTLPPQGRLGVWRHTPKGNPGRQGRSPAFYAPNPERPMRLCRYGLRKQGHIALRVCRPQRGIIKLFMIRA